MKKITVFLIAIVFLVGLVSCNGETNNTSSTDSDISSNTSSDDNLSDTSIDTTSQVESSEDSSNESIEESTPSSLLQGSLDDILADVYEGIENEEVKNSIVGNVVTTIIDPANCKYYFGVDSLDFKEGIASEYEMGGAYSVCIIRANSIDDVETLKETIKNNVDPFKWVCMGVEDDKVVVDSIGDVVILIMNDKSELLHEAFLNLK